jgi:hypothetical protein
MVSRASTSAVAAEAVEAGYKLVEELLAGITYFALHCRRAGRRRGDHAAARALADQRIYVFASGAVTECCAALGLVPIGYRDIERLRRKTGSSSPPHIGCRRDSFAEQL